MTLLILAMSSWELFQYPDWVSDSGQTPEIGSTSSLSNWKKRASTGVMAQSTITSNWPRGGKETQEPQNRLCLPCHPPKHSDICVPIPFFSTLEREASFPKKKAAKCHEFGNTELTGGSPWTITWITQRRKEILSSVLSYYFAIRWGDTRQNDTCTLSSILHC